MRLKTPWSLLAAGLVSLALTTAVYGAETFVEAASAPNPDKAAGRAAAPRGPSLLAPRETSGTITTYATRAAFQADFPGLPLEDFEEGNAPGGGFSVCDSPLDDTGDAACGFAPGDILSGVAFQDNPGPDLGSLILLGAGTSLNPTMALIANTFADSFDILFDPPVGAAGMDLHSTDAPGSGPPDTLTIQLFDAGNALIDTVPAAAASGPGVFFGVSSTTPIARISMLSTNNRAEGVDNIEFSGEPALVASQVDFADSCPTNPNNVNGVFEPGETIEIDVELTAVAGSFTGISGVLTSSTVGVTIVNGNATWPDLASGASAFPAAPFTIRLDQAIACGSSVDLDVTVSANEGGPFVISLSELVGQPLAPNVPVAIPDANPAGVTSDLVVADNVILTDVNVRVQISHTWVGDLLITLRAPDNTEVVLLDRPGVPVSGAGCPDNNMDVTFDDASGFDPENHCAASDPWFVGTANPVGSLATFNGFSSAGTWRLFVSDNAGQDLGTIDNWELITTPAISGVCNVCIGGDADLSIVKTPDQGTVGQGDPLTYTLTVTNNGPDPATSVVVTDTLPAGLIYASDNCGGVFVDPTFTWNIGNLAVAASVQCQLTVTVDPLAPDGPIVNTATVAAAETDPTPGNSTSTTTINVSQFGLLEVPTLDRVGLAILLLVLGTAAVVMLRRRAQ